MGVHNSFPPVRTLFNFRCTLLGCPANRLNHGAMLLPLVKVAATGAPCDSRPNIKPPMRTAVANPRMAKARPTKRTSTPAKTTAMEITPFQASVYALTSQIPRGKVTTYGRIAKALNSSPRAGTYPLQNPQRQTVFVLLIVMDLRGSWQCSPTESICPEGSMSSGHREYPLPRRISGSMGFEWVYCSQEIGVVEE